MPGHLLPIMHVEMPEAPQGAPQGAGSTPRGAPQGAGSTPRGAPQGAGSTPRGAPQGAGSRKAEAPPLVAYVLGGGGDLGANEVGMLRALLERDIRPDLIVGTSIGAINGADIAATPTLDILHGIETTRLRHRQVS